MKDDFIKRKYRREYGKAVRFLTRRNGLKEDAFDFDYASEVVEYFIERADDRLRAMRFGRVLKIGIRLLGFLDRIRKTEGKDIGKLIEAGEGLDEIYGDYAEYAINFLGEEYEQKFISFYNTRYYAINSISNLFEPEFILEKKKLRIRKMIAGFLDKVCEWVCKKIYAKMLEAGKRRVRLVVDRTGEVERLRGSVFYALTAINYGEYGGGKALNAWMEIIEMLKGSQVIKEELKGEFSSWNIEFMDCVRHQVFSESSELGNWVMLRHMKTQLEELSADIGKRKFDLEELSEYNEREQARIREKREREHKELYGDPLYNWM